MNVKNQTEQLKRHVSDLKPGIKQTLPLKTKKISNISCR